LATYPTAGPVSMVIEIGAGNVRVVASERGDADVDVRPTDPARAGDVSLAAETRSECAEGKLTIRAPRGWLRYGLLGGRDSVDLLVRVPEGSRVSCDAGAGVATFRSEGALGDCRVRLGAGEIEVDQAGAAQLETGAGAITAHRVAGRAELRTGSGAVRVGLAGGGAAVRNSNGETWLGEAFGAVEVHSANGRIVVERAHDAVVANTACGDIRLGRVESGAIAAHTAYGRVEVGVADGVAAWLDLSTQFGRVLNELESAERPDPTQRTVEVRARTAYGDIRIHRTRTAPAERGQA